jgi:hypothetical protein
VSKRDRWSGRDVRDLIRRAEGGRKGRFGRTVNGVMGRCGCELLAKERGRREVEGHGGRRGLEGGLMRRGKGIGMILRESTSGGLTNW